MCEKSALTLSNRLVGIGNNIWLCDFDKIRQTYLRLEMKQQQGRGGRGSGSGSRSKSWNKENTTDFLLFGKICQNAY